MQKMKIIMFWWYLPDQIGAEKSIDVLYLDFPAKKKNKLSKEQTAHNESLAEKYNQSGLFPHIILMDKNEKIVKTISYEGQDVDTFIKMLN